MLKGINSWQGGLYAPLGHLCISRFLDLLRDSPSGLSTHRCLAHRLYESGRNFQSRLYHSSGGQKSYYQLYGVYYHFHPVRFNLMQSYQQTMTSNYDDPLAISGISLPLLVEKTWLMFLYRVPDNDWVGCAHSQS